MTRVCAIAVAAMLALALLISLCRLGDDESVVVSLADAETAIVVALPAADIGPPPPVAERVEPVATLPVEVAALPEAEAASSPLIGDWAEPVAAPLVKLAALPGAETVLLPKIKLAPEPTPKPALGPTPILASRPPLATVVARTQASIVGIASTYNPFRRRTTDTVALTASGEVYDPDAWTAAIQIDRRHEFGGVRYGRLYRPAFALVERGDKRVIVRINDVGPLRPGRVIDLNERSMRYFDPTMRLGLVRNMRITALPGNRWTPGPVEAESGFDLASAM